MVVEEGDGTLQDLRSLWEVVDHLRVGKCKIETMVFNFKKTLSSIMLL
jgi:hypothetical protein